MLGVKITHNSDSICLDQQHVAESLLDQYSMCKCQPVSTPLVPNEHLSTATEEEITALKNLRVNYRSAIGYLATFHGCPVLWKTRKQPLVSISTAEAKHKALCDLTSELLWLKQWSEEAQILNFTTPITVWEDNRGCINTANGDCNFNSQRMEHVDIQLHFVKEVIWSSIIRLCYEPSSEMLADFLTKSVNKVILVNFLEALGILRIAVRGDVKEPDLIPSKRLRSRITTSPEVLKRLL
ncbi:hypothetical protein O181_056849 [Austropuccinia psidii MF-1]|uniref:Uncharacterized protein n=1 Tax=Austropuccinia psidii MF-1 TaxID=1389203 RepID=A0A9Q3HW29_9BASI|nr:hypothetical protein [Austropuccinia psidii MF-1]